MVANHLDHPGLRDLAIMSDVALLRPLTVCSSVQRIRGGQEEMSGGGGIRLPVALRPTISPTPGQSERHVTDALSIPDGE